MTQPLAADDLRQLVDALLRPGAVIETVVVLGCLVLAWGVVRLWRGSQARRG